MANTHETLGNLFADIADAIRAKTGNSEPLVADQFPEAIAGIEVEAPREYRQLSLSTGTTQTADVSGWKKAVVFSVYYQKASAGSSNYYGRYVVHEVNVENDEVTFLVNSGSLGINCSCSGGVINVAQGFSGSGAFAFVYRTM